MELAPETPPKCPLPLLPACVSSGPAGSFAHQSLPHSRNITAQEIRKEEHQGVTVLPGDHLILLYFSLLLINMGVG